VTAAVIMTSTTSADVSPSHVTYGIPATINPQMAMTTVPPAKSTACPAVPFARPIDSITGMPAARFWRWRVRMNSE
jgi:hypothetical protein